MQMKKNVVEWQKRSDEEDESADNGDGDADDNARGSSANNIRAARRATCMRETNSGSIGSGGR